MKWISVKERLPEIYTTCLVFNDSVEMCIYLPNGIWEGEDKNEKYRITHWMPLPEPPKQK